MEDKVLIDTLKKKVIGVALAISALGGLIFGSIAPTTEKYGSLDSFWFNINRENVKSEYLRWAEPTNTRVRKYLSNSEECPSNKECFLEVEKHDCYNTLLGYHCSFNRYEIPKRFYLESHQNNPILDKFGISYIELRDIVREYHGPAHYGKLEDFVRTKLKTNN
jgi:hypothetical protein